MAVLGEPSSWSDCSVSIDPVVVGVRAVYYSAAFPPNRKRVMLEGNVCSPHSSSSRLNWTCFLGLSSAGVGALPHHVLLLHSQVLACSFKSHIWRHSHSLGGPDHGGLGDDEEDCLWHSGTQLGHLLDLPLPLNGEHHFLNSDHPIGESSLSSLIASLVCGSTEGK